MGQSERVVVSQVRAVVTGLMRGEPMSIESIEAARGAVRSMCQQAAAHGLTTADVVRALLLPVFEDRRGCDCPTCTARRTRWDTGSLWRGSVTMA
ncbi:MAG: hypothetical protein QF659_05090 [Dehalococcoidia bacterium]|jgi:hypothetical protein|nr:hypothetical protein [Dehalococcoidia bacterium]